MSWGKWGKNLSQTSMSNLIEFDVAHGITTFDHADIYGDYSTEAAFGKALKHSTVQREEIQLISKCGIQLINKERNNVVKHYQYNSEYIINQVETSLQNLKTEYLDLLLLHRPSPLMNFKTIGNVISKLKKEGKIKHFGVSNFTSNQISLLSDFVDVESNQIQCSLTHFQDFINDELHYLSAKNILPMAWQPLGSSMYLNKSEPLQLCLEKLSLKYSTSIAGIVLAFLLKHPAIIHPVIGTTTFTRIKSLKQAENINLETQDWFKLLELSRGQEVD